MKKLLSILGALIITLTVVTSCSMSTEELSNQVITSMKDNEQFKSNSIKIKSLILTKKAGNEYSGVLETKEPNGDFNYTVEVIYDGENMTWKILE